MVKSAVAQASTPDLDQAFRTLRTVEFPWTGETTYLNNAATGPLPERSRRVLEEMAAGRTAPHLLLDRELFAGLADLRVLVARLLNADVDEIALANNTTFGLSLAARGLPLKAGDTVLIPERELPANVYPWLMQRSRGIRVEVVPLTPEGWPDEDRIVERLSDPAVKALSISWVQFSSGYRADLDRLGAACRANGAFFVVDAIQGVGQIPLDVAQTRIDVLACGGQKWLLSPWGSGFVYVRKEIQDQLEPVTVGWMSFEGTDDFSKLTEYNTTLRDNARRYEAGTPPFQDQLAFRESLKMMLDLGIEQIAARNRALREPLLAAGRRGEITIASPTDPDHACAMVCVVPGHVAEAFHNLKKANVICALREGRIRIAPHCYNTIDEVEKVVALLTGR